MKNTEDAITNKQSRESGNNGHTSRRQTKQKAQHNMRKQNTNNVNYNQMDVKTILYGANAI